MAKATRRAKPARPNKAAEKISVAERSVNQTEMAAILGVSTRFIRELTADGTIERVGSGYPIGRTVRAYADFLKVGSEKRSGSSSMDELRAEKALDIRLNRMRKDRELVSMDEAIAFAGELTGLFVSYLSAVPAEITGVPRERQRINEIIDRGRQRLVDRLAKKRQDFLGGGEDPDAEAQD
jgi:hypothetical protein